MLVRSGSKKLQWFLEEENLTLSSQQEDNVSPDISTIALLACLWFLEEENLALGSQQEDNLSPDVSTIALLACLWFLVEENLTVGSQEEYTLSPDVSTMTLLVCDSWRRRILLSAVNRKTPYRKM